MNELSDEVASRLRRLDALRKQFVIRAASLPADFALVGLYNDVYDSASLAADLCEPDIHAAAFPLARTVFEAAQRLIALATDEDYLRTGVRAWLYYLRKDARVAHYAHGAEAARRWAEQAIGTLRDIWARYNQKAQAIIQDENARLDSFQKQRKPDNFMGDDLAAVVERRYSRLSIAAGKSVSDLTDLNRGIYTALSRESHARVRLDPAALKIAPDGSVSVIPQLVDPIAKTTLVLGCLASSLAETGAALAYLVEHRRSENDERVRLRAADLATTPLPPNFKPDLGLHLLHNGGGQSWFRFPNVPVQKLGFRPDGIGTWSGNILFTEVQEYIATFDVAPRLVPDLARALQMDVRELRPSKTPRKHILTQPGFVSVDCRLGEVHESETDSFVPLFVTKVARSSSVV
jgi:hypothetical protein